MDLSRISKAIAGGIATASGVTGTASVVIPSSVDMPWYGYAVIGVLNFILGFGVVYLAPANKP